MRILRMFYLYIQSCTVISYYYLILVLMLRVLRRLQRDSLHFCLCDIVTKPKQKDQPMGSALQALVYFSFFGLLRKDMVILICSA